MTPAAANQVSEMLPKDAWECLKDNAAAVLIDVRTRAEWSFVGVPDLSELNRSVIRLEWRRFPDMSVNPTFADELLDGFGDRLPTQFLFICRSGARSFEAARSAAAALALRGSSAPCVNVAEGFEGDLDTGGHRGDVNGWKAAGLPWRQT